MCTCFKFCFRFCMLTLLTIFLNKNEWNATSYDISLRFLCDMCSKATLIGVEHLFMYWMYDIIQCSIFVDCSRDNYFLLLVLQKYWFHNQLKWCKHNAWFLLKILSVSRWKRIPLSLTNATFPGLGTVSAFYSLTPYIINWKFYTEKCIYYGQTEMP